VALGAQQKCNHNAIVQENVGIIKNNYYQLDACGFIVGISLRQVALDVQLIFKNIIQAQPDTWQSLSAQNLRDTQFTTLAL
jgi:hypothetical protein